MTLGETASRRSASAAALAVLLTLVAGCGAPPGPVAEANAAACTAPLADCYTPGVCNIDTSTNTSHCGGCNLACSGANQVTITCTGGVCDGQCSGGQADCDSNKQTNGCETNVNSNISHCGGCGNVCSTNHVATQVCSSGYCTGACTSGWGDCNSNKLTDGCETALNTGTNCGACGASCSANHVPTPTCSSGTCNGTCAPGWADCNADKRNDGCETDVAGGVNDCGGCGRVCSANHITGRTCSGGICNGVCDPGWADCNGDKQADGCETNIADQTNHCGGCGITCSSINVPLPACTGGVCTGPCGLGSMDCDGDKRTNGCETSYSGLDSCGGCGIVCSSNHIPARSCTAGYCGGACEAGWSDCNYNKQVDGCETDTASTVASCGACNAACSTNHISAACSAGQCTGTCQPGWADCNGNKRSDGCETDLGSSVTSCGGCGVTCSTSHLTGATCSAGTCGGTCDAGWADCNGNKQSDGCEVPVGTNPAHCGGCNAVCSQQNLQSWTCAAGECTGACAAGFADCNGDKRSDGCEVSLGADPAHCGACGAACSANHVAPACASETCTGACQAGWGDCNGDKRGDGCETPLDTTASCGACGATCALANATSSCSTGTCAIVACADGWGDCDGNPANGCEVRIDTPANCGGCGIACAPAGSCQQAATCNPVAKACTYTAKADFTACDDGNACTLNDVCQAGVCASGTPKTCTASDPCHDAGTCNPADGTCSSPAKPNGTACSDGNACTQTDSCQAGVCTGASPKTCTASDPCHDAGTCNQADGSCSNPAKPNGTTCSDGNACTQTDTCQAGACTGANPKTCTASDQCHDAGACNPATGICSNPSRADNSPCDDGNLCTLADLCQAGACVGGFPRTCFPIDQCHDAGTCNPADGACSTPAKPDGTGCDDGDACTLTDACHTGTCAGGSPKSCPAPDQCHLAGTCSPADGSCSSLAKPDGASCDDGNACTLDDTCQSGACAGASPKLCVASDACHDAGTCNPSTGLCSSPSRPDGSPCDDGNLCTVADACQAGSCTGAPKSCPPPTQCHDAGLCNPFTGSCTPNPKPDGTACDDGNACTTADTCQGGSCFLGGFVTCTAQDDCHDAGVCDPTTGCTNPAKTDGAPCTDGDLCTQTDACASGVCAGTNPVVCPAADACHQPRACVPATGACTNTPKDDGTPCDDGLVCSTGEACLSGLCTPAQNVCCASDLDCLAIDQCHLPGTCDVTTGACTSPAKADGVACNDGNACTQLDSCQFGLCVGANPILCGPLGPCRAAGTCDPGTGACSDPAAVDGTPCSDGDACTTGDRCVSGACAPVARAGGACGCTSNADCPPADSCHLQGTCNLLTGACTPAVKPDGAACDDGSLCSTGESCTAGVCGTPTSARDCAPIDACHLAGTCDPGSGACTTPTATDGTACSGGQCVTGTCVASGGGTPSGSGGGGGGCATAGGGAALWVLLGVLGLAARHRRRPGAPPPAQ